MCYNRGFLNPDENGRCSWQQIYGALRLIGCRKAIAMFQAAGIVGYKENDPHQKWRIRGGKKRFFNVFKMNVGDDTARPEFFHHGFATTVRDARLDGLKTTQGRQTPAEVAALVRASRKKRFDELVTAEGVIENGSEPRITLRSLAKMLATQKTVNGNRDGEWSLAGPTLSTDGSHMQNCHPNAVVIGRLDEQTEWQAVFAQVSALVAFGETDDDGEPYLSLKDFEAMYLDSQFPERYVTREWGFWECWSTAARLSSAALVLPKIIQEKFLAKHSAKDSDFKLMSLWTNYVMKDLGQELDADPVRVSVPVSSLVGPS